MSDERKNEAGNIDDVLPASPPAREAEGAPAPKAVVASKPISSIPFTNETSSTKNASKTKAAKSAPSAPSGPSGPSSETSETSDESKPAPAKKRSLHFSGNSSGLGRKLKHNAMSVLLALGLLGSLLLVFTMWLRLANVDQELAKLRQQAKAAQPVTSTLPNPAPASPTSANTNSASTEPAPQLPGSLPLPLSGASGVELRLPKETEEAIVQLSRALNGYAKKVEEEQDRTQLPDRIKQAMAPFMNKLTEEIEPLRTDIKEFKLRTEIAETVTRVSAQPEEVALVIFNTPELEAKPFDEFIREQVIRGGLLNRYTDYRLGIFLGVNGAVVPLQGFERPGVSPRLILEPIKLPDSKATESIDQLRTNEMFINARTGVPRRAILVASIKAEVPSAIDSWKDVETSILLIDQSNNLQKQQAAVEKWKRFCERTPTKGEAKAMPWSDDVTVRAAVFKELIRLLKHKPPRQVGVNSPPGGAQPKTNVGGSSPPAANNPSPPNASPGSPTNPSGNPTSNPPGNPPPGTGN